MATETGACVRTGPLPDHVLAPALPAAAAPPKPVHEAAVLQRRLVLRRGRPHHAHLHPHPRAHRLCWHLPHRGLLVGCRCALLPTRTLHVSTCERMCCACRTQSRQCPLLSRLAGKSSKDRRSKTLMEWGMSPACKCQIPGAYGKSTHIAERAG